MADPELSELIKRWEEKLPVSLDENAELAGQVSKSLKLRNGSEICSDRIRKTEFQREQLRQSSQGLNPGNKGTLVTQHERQRLEAIHRRKNRAQSLWDSVSFMHGQLQSAQSFQLWQPGQECVQDIDFVCALMEIQVFYVLVEAQVRDIGKLFCHAAEVRYVDRTGGDRHALTSFEPLATDEPTFLKTVLCDVSKNLEQQGLLFEEDTQIRTARVALRVASTEYVLPDSLR